MAELVPGNVQNSVSTKEIRTRSKFNLSAPFFNTLRFAEYSPHYVYDGVPDDKKITLNCNHDLSTYTFKAPLKQDITMNKDYFIVPRESVLPRNWSLIYVNPKKGDDVPSDSNSTVIEFFQKMSNLALRCALGMDPIQNPTPLTTWFGMMRWFLLFENFFSQGSLLSTLGCHPSKHMIRFYDHVNKRFLTFDKAQDRIFGLLQEYMISGTPANPSLSKPVNGCDVELSQGFQNTSTPQTTQVWVVKDEDVDPVLGFVNFRYLVDYVRANGIGSLYGPDANVSNFQDTAALTEAATIFATISVQASRVDVDIAIPVAYQLCCAHYYTNDNVDNIYSAELYRQASEDLAKLCIESQIGVYPVPFTWNGITKYYDVFSAKVFDSIYTSYLNSLQYDVLNTNDFCATGFRPCTMFGAWFEQIFAYRRTLRYQDYFTGARTRPLAVGDVDVNVTPGTPAKVNVINITRNIQRQRFFNAVNRARSQFDEYLQDIFGSKPQPDYHNPFYVAHTSDSIRGYNIENTGSDQLTKAQTQTAIMHSNAGKYAFEVELDRPAIILGITHFDITRFYANGVHKMFTHVDRFDMFNPFMQFIGDQPINLPELDSCVDGPYAYTTRHMEYKQMYPTCAGGVQDYLPGFAFIAPPILEQRIVGTINPEYIRCQNVELDQFYTSLTGYSLASYFHFIVLTNNDVHASRPMAFNPNIL